LPSRDGSTRSARCSRILFTTFSSLTKARTTRRPPDKLRAELDAATATRAASPGSELRAQAIAPPLLLENLFRILPVIDAGRISRLGRVDLGVGRVVGLTFRFGWSTLAGTPVSAASIWAFVGLGACFFRDL